MMRPGVVWFGPDCSLYVLFFDLWRASVDAIWWMCVYGWNSTDSSRGWVAGAGLVREKTRAQVTCACTLLIAIVGLLVLLCTWWVLVLSRICVTIWGARCGLLYEWVGSELI